jgi:hypothetical protein
MLMRWHEYVQPCGDRQLSLVAAAAGHAYRRFGMFNGYGREAGGHAQISLFGVRIRTSSGRWTWMAALLSTTVACGRLNGVRV